MCIDADFINRARDPFRDINNEPGQLSRYKDSLRAVRSEDQMLVRARFSAPVHAGHGANPASYTMSNVTGRGLHQPPTSRAEVAERVDLRGPSRVNSKAIPVQAPRFQDN